MNMKHFGHYVASLAQYDTLVALSAKPFLARERHTYTAVQHEIYQTAHYLLSEGIVSGDRIMILAVNSPEWIILFLAAQCIGATIVPVDARSNAEAAASYAEQTKPRLVFAQTHLAVGLKKTYKQRSIDELPRYRDGFPSSPPKGKLTGEETAVIVFTSGTTDAPKGVVLTQKNILANVTGVLEVVHIDTSWQLMSVLPLSHMFELTASLAIISRGAGLHYLNRVSPAAISEGFNTYRPTAMLAVPELLSVLLERIKQGAEATGKTKLLALLMRVAAHVPFDLRHALFASVHRQLGGRLRVLIVGGAPVPIATAEAWELMGVKVVQGYGLTETAPILTVNGLDERRLDSQGMVLSNITLRIASDGEIQAKGPSVFGQYWQNTTATAAAFTSDGWFRTGDVGRLDSRWLYIQGRAKFTIVLANGLKVFPEDVETAMYGLTALQNSCVVGHKKAEGEAVEAAVVSTCKDAEIEQAIAAANARLQPFQHITAWRRWPDSDFPRTRLLKVNRKAVQAWVNHPSHATQAPSDEPSQTGDRLLECIRLSADKPRLTVRGSERLADLGLDSLRRLNLVSLIEEQLGKSLPEESVAPGLTVTALRRMVEKATTKPPKERRSRWQFMPGVRLLGNLIRDTIGRGATRLWVTQHTEGSEHIPHTGPALYVFNHTDNFDGPVAYFSLPRRIRSHLAVSHAADFMHEHQVVSFLSRLCFAAFPFARQAPFMPSLEQTAELVEQGWNVAIFPEGSIARTDRLRSFKSGVGLLAVELQIPIVPVRIKGLHGTFPLHAAFPHRHSRVTVSVGKPLMFHPGISYDDATSQIRQAIETL